MNNKWILTSEREPEKAGYYIITTKYGEVGYMHYYNGWNKHNDDGTYEIDSSYIQAWMPFPEPYQDLVEHYGQALDEMVSEFTQGE